MRTTKAYTETSFFKLWQILPTHSNIVYCIDANLIQQAIEDMALCDNGSGSIKDEVGILSSCLANAEKRFFVELSNTSGIKFEERSFDNFEIYQVMNICSFAELKPDNTCIDASDLFELEFLKWKLEHQKATNNTIDCVALQLAELCNQGETLHIESIWAILNSLPIEELALFARESTILLSKRINK